VRTLRLRVLSVLIAVGPLLSAGPLRAAGTPDATVQAMYQQALLQMEQKDYAAACPALEEVVRRVPEGIGAKLTLAQCYEDSGRLATAFSAYQVAETAASQANQVERKIRAQSHMEALRPRLAKLVIQVSEATRTLPELEVKCDGIPMEPLKWAVALPADKGKHIITARAQGKQRWEKTFEVRADGAIETMTIDGLIDDPSGGSKKEDDEKPIAPPPQPLGTRRVAGIAVGVAGLLAIAAGSGLGALAISKKNESNKENCNALNQCDSTGLALRASGRNAGNASTGLFIAGGVALAIGVTLLVFPRATSGVKATATIGPSGLFVHGAW